MIRVSVLNNTLFASLIRFKRLFVLLKALLLMALGLYTLVEIYACVSVRVCVYLWSDLDIIRNVTGVFIPERV